MSYFLKAKKLDIKTGQQIIALFDEEEAFHFGIRPGDKIEIKWRGKIAVVEANTSVKRIQRGFIGLYSDFWDKYKSLQDLEIVEINFVGRAESVKAIKKKLRGENLNQEEYNSIVQDIVENRLSNTQIAYFIASSYMNPYTNQELFYMTKAMAENGGQLDLKGMVADKHSIGGVAGNRTTMIVIPIIASLGIQIAKSSSRAITSVSGTADTMEVLCPVSHSIKKIKQIIKKTNACIVWGGGLNLAPADDRIIKVNYPIAMESYDKALISIMAKKIATSATHLVIDLPYGPTTKVPDKKDAELIKKKFEYLAQKFKMKISVQMVHTTDPIGKGIGPALEARDVLRVLQQKENKPGDLENKSISLAGKLIELCKKAPKGQGDGLAWKQLKDGLAWKKMQEIIQVQGGNPQIDSEDITIAAIKHYVNAEKNGKITLTNNTSISNIARTLGAPSDKLAGIYLNKEYGNRIKKGERLYTLYAQNQERMDLAKIAIKKKENEIFHIE